MKMDLVPIRKVYATDSLYRGPYLDAAPGILSSAAAMATVAHGTLLWVRFPPRSSADNDGNLWSSVDPALSAGHCVF